MSDLLGRKRVLVIGLFFLDFPCRRIIAESDLADRQQSNPWNRRSNFNSGCYVAQNNNFPIGLQRNKAFGIFGAIGSKGERPDRSKVFCLWILQVRDQFFI
ncbi:hypothetical protein [Paenibacillus glycinis]|uniref:Secreted protein n=1 Tax=Paenibacillus glycinis TaxID=2697035 RepID=A0ABW9XKV2_9BACL|nr:hypothetical protein [Paenibacillus glycinis]NBD23084.1 hypothetical protein [Paenibacillus glycinis]